MTTSAHKDQFQPEPDLESDCRKARAKALDVCVWEVSEIDCYDFWRSGCGKKFNFYSDDDTPESEGFRFCPFCGKKIEVKK